MNRADAAPSGKHIARREAIMLGAARVFAQKGFHAASVQDVAAHMGINKATLYHYFSSKDELALEIFRYAEERTVELRDIIDAKDLTPIDRLKSYIVEQITWYLEHPDIARVVFAERGLTGDLREAQQQRRDRYSSRMVQLIRDCAEADASFEAIDVSLAANFINGAIATTNLWYNPAGQWTPSYVATGFSDMAERLIRRSASK